MLLLLYCHSVDLFHFEYCYVDFISTISVLISFEMFSFDHQESCKTSKAMVNVKDIRNFFKSLKESNAPGLVGSASHVS